MAFDADVKSYLRAYQKEYDAAKRGGQHTAELSFRVPMHTLFRSIAKDLNPKGNFDIILEPKNQGRMGRPDWRIQDAVSLGVYGYIEGKGPSEEAFDISPYKNQIDRYLTLGHKLVITDGIDFVFCFTQTPIVVSIIDKGRMGAADWSRLSINPQFRFYMEQFFSNPAPQRVDEEKLIELVAIRTRNLADDIFAHSDLTVEEALNDDERRVIALLDGLKELVYNHNDPTLRTGAVFSDFTAQVIMFCLLYAHRVLCLSSDTPTEKAEKIRAYAFNDIVEGEALLPFRNLMVYLRDHAGDGTFIGQWVDECIAFLSFVQMTEQQLLNPDYHGLFELFLTKFDAQSRFDYGAFYTPKVLADFIVRFTNHLVQTNFDGASIYDDGNTIIDPCCGTGSFLERIIAHDEGDGAYNLCGFEILPAPYMLANYRMAVVERQYNKLNLDTNVLLANTLSNCLLGEEANPASIEGQELIRAKELSSRPIRLIIGNPPCSDNIRNNVSTDFSKIAELMDDFRPPVENRHNRQNIQKQINNPFLQFIRWSCEKLFASECHSVLALVVPLSFLEAESYKYARKYLAAHFSNLWAIAIDADARTGIRGDSLFHTMQGRAVILLTRKFNETASIEEVNYIDLSRGRRAEKIALLETDIQSIIETRETFKLADAMYSFMPSRPFNQEQYAHFWPISSQNGDAVFLYQCSGAKMAPTALLTHVRQPMLKRRSREIAIGGIEKAKEWIGRQDKLVVDAKITAFQNALNTCADRHALDTVLNETIRPCSFRPFVNSNAFLWDTVFEHQAGVGGGGARIRPEIKAIYDRGDTVGFSLAHAPKDLDESLGQFSSFCWYFPDNDLSRRGNGHVYLNQYIPDPKSGEVVNNVNGRILDHFGATTGLSAKDCSRKIVFYAYAVFCSQVYLEEFYGALYVVNQSESRARIPVVADGATFLEMATIGERIAELEKSETAVENVLNLDYDALIDQLPEEGFWLEHSRSVSRSPYDEENEELVVRAENSDVEIRVYCPAAIQKFTVAGYNVIKDCWLKFHSYRFTHCEFRKDDFRELLDLLNKIATQMQIVAQIDEYLHGIVNGEIPLLDFHE